MFSRPAQQAESMLPAGFLACGCPEDAVLLRPFACLRRHREFVCSRAGHSVSGVLLGIVAVVMTLSSSNNTRFGRYAYAIGGNREAARLSGINIRREISDFRLDGIPVRPGRDCAVRPDVG